MSTEGCCFFTLSIPRRNVRNKNTIKPEDSKNLKRASRNGCESMSLHLLGLSQKVQGIGYLISVQNNNGCPPHNLAELLEGIGKVVQGLGSEVYEV